VSLHRISIQASSRDIHLCPSCFLNEPEFQPLKLSNNTDLFNLQVFNTVDFGIMIAISKDIDANFFTLDLIYHELSDIYTKLFQSNPSIY